MLPPEIDVRPLSPERLESLIGVRRATRFRRTAAQAREMLDGRTVWNVNSTATGGGVAELLQTLLAFARGVGVDARWVVIRGDPRFFDITKRIHNHLYGSPGDGGPLARDEHRDYEATLARNRDALVANVRAGDVVVLHDPQTAGLARDFKRAGAAVVWRCHVGIDEQNTYSALGWEFLRPYLEPADAFVFSRAEFAPEWIDRRAITVIAPSIDPFAAKNEPVPTGAVRARLRAVGVLDARGARPGATYPFTRRDGSVGRVQCQVDLLGTAPVPARVPVVLQASRWDAMKDMRGVLTAFAEHVDAMGDAHLLLTGPSSLGVVDDPEGAAVLEDCLTAWTDLAPAVRSRVHLACVPLTDPDEAAAVVNAMQRYATIVVQKSIAEGFGLTVAEAMWKARPVVASNVGGIADQVVSGHTGILVDDPRDLDTFAHALRTLLHDRAYARTLGRNGRRRAGRLFLGDLHLERWAALLGAFAGRSACATGKG